MRITARQVRSSTGHLPVHEGLFLSDLKAQPLGTGEEKKSVWEVDVKLCKDSLMRLLRHKELSLLAARLISLEKIPESTVVLAGYGGGVRVIRTQQKEYREKKREIHTRSIK